ncbi:MAG: enoyl-CoA hydratase-related protein [Thermodesulfobacteriota bacterium]
MSDQKKNPDATWPLGRPPVLGEPIPETMQALTIHRNDYGPPKKVVRLETVPTPLLREHEAGRVLVAVLASGPNYNTNFAALGLPVPAFGRGDAATLHIPGSDALGIVVDAGAAVTRVKVGQAVILDSWTGRNIRGYETHDGFNAQFAVVDEGKAIPLPETLQKHSPESLAAMLLTYGTAYRAVVERLRVSPGDSVLVMGGGKGTSFAGAQMAKALGARVILVGSNPALAEHLIARGIADAFINRRNFDPALFGVIDSKLSPTKWERRTEPFRRAVRQANKGRLVDKVFEHTGGANFPLLVSCLNPGGRLAFFGATGQGLKGEYKETFFYEGRRLVMDARWVWMRQKQVLFRSGSAERILKDAGLFPGRRVLVWGADAYAQSFIRAAFNRSAEVAVIASRTKEEKGVKQVIRLGVRPDHILNREDFLLPEDMPDPLTEKGEPNPQYQSDYMRQAQALGKALWNIFGTRQNPDLVVERTDQSTLHFSTFVARDFNEKDVMPCGLVVARGGTDLSICGSHMFSPAQAADVVRLLSAGTLVMEQEDLEITDLPGIADLQQKMLEGTMKKPKGVALVQADRPGRSVADYEAAFRGDALLTADPQTNRLIDVRLIKEVGLVTLCRPEALNALNDDLISQLKDLVREIATHRSVSGRSVKALIITGAGRSFVAGADVNAFRGSAAIIGGFARKNIGVFSDLEKLPLPVIALVDGFGLGGGNELAMSTHYRIVTENAQLGQPEVKLGIIPGYGGLQRLPRMIGPVKAAEMCINGEPVDAFTAVKIGLADEFAPSATALVRAFTVARRFIEGTMPFPSKEWDKKGEKQKEELKVLFARPDVKRLLNTPTPSARRAGDLGGARMASARDTLLAIQYGYAQGFEQGLKNDAVLFGKIAASPAGQEWINRFLAKDPLQSSFLTLLP